MANGAGSIYAIGVEGLPSVKIGKTTGQVAHRLASLQTGHPGRLTVLAAVPVAQHLSRIETAIHRFLEADRQQGEWFATQITQAQLEALIVRAVQWLAEEETPQAAQPATRTGIPFDPALFATRVRLARNRLDVSQQTIATQAHLTLSHYNEIENARHPGLRIQTLYALCQVLRCSSDYLLGLSDTPAPRPTEVLP